MNERVLWRLVIAAPVLFGALKFAAAEDDWTSAKLQPSRRVFEELEPAELTNSSMTADETSLQLVDACVEKPSCGTEATGCCTSAPNACVGEGACDDCCSQPCFTFLIGTEATFLAPQGSGGRISASGTDLTIPRTISEDEEIDFDGLTFAPRFWLGVQGAEWGFLTRFWYLNDSDEQFRAFDQNGLDGLPGSYSIDRTKAYTFDWELTRACCWNESKLNFGIGGRYASLEAGGAAAVAGIANGALDFFQATAISDIDFEGTGLTASIGGRTPISDCWGCVYLFWGVRGSVLWGDSSNSVQTTATTLTVGSASTTIDAATVSDDGSSMYIFETQLGAQWEHELKCMPAAAFVRLAAEYQLWSIDGGSVESFSTSFTPDAVATSSAISDDFDLSLLGFTIGTGLTW
ncbi:MAG: hypothetical protein AB7O26_01420 [Planctomycetaceae bacterium]